MLEETRTFFFLSCIILSSLSPISSTKLASKILLDETDMKLDFCKGLGIDGGNNDLF